MAGAAQRGQDVECPRLQVVAEEGFAAGEVEVSGEPTDAGEHQHRGGIQIWALGDPRRDDAIDFVGGAVGWVISHTSKIVDVKTLSLGLLAPILPGEDVSTRLDTKAILPDLPR